MKSLLFSSLAVAFLSTFAHADDSMYPPAPAAASVIQIDGKGFTINRQRTYISSGSVHYPRVPRELWLDRLLRVKRGGFNTVQTYAFWNFHEPVENEFDFTGPKDIGQFFSDAQKTGLYVIARVGPYACGEWDSGGYPVWLKFLPPFNLRSDNPTWLGLNDHWYEKILPIVAAHQINHGGNVIMVQLENEHPKGWGVVHSPYFDHLSDEAVKLGVEVPYFMSGLNHGANPYPSNPDTSQRTTPRFTTEFWTGWFNLYGDLKPHRLAELESSQWRIIALGGAGYNFYMLHGGSNFDSWNSSNCGGSYDYASPIGQAGDLRPIYYRMKRANQLAQSFPDILANGSDANGPEYKDFVQGADLLGVRRSPVGTAVFIHSSKESVATLKDGTTLHTRAHETFAFIRDTTIADGLKIADSTVRMLGMARNGNTITIVVHGVPGDTGSLTFSSTGTLKLQNVSKAFASVAADAGQLKLNITTPPTGPDECMIEDGKLSICVLAVSSDLGCYTWFIGDQGKQDVVLGPEYVGDFQVDADGKPTMTIERRYGALSCGQVAVYGAAGQEYHLGVKIDTSVDTLPAPVLENWSMAVSPESTPQFDDSKWKTSDVPLQMGADGDYSAFAWYRANADAPAAGPATFRFSGEDHLIVFVNGQQAVEAKHTGKQWDFTAPVVAGKNSIAVFASHVGRSTQYQRLGTIDTFERKGIYGDVKMTLDGKETDVTGWRMHGGMNPTAPFLKWDNTVKDGNGPAFYKATFTAKPPGETGAYPILRADFSNLSRGTMWLNGHNLGRYPETIPISSIYLPECWLKDGQNEFIILDEKGIEGTKSKLYVETAASREVIRVSEPVDPSTPIVVPPEIKIKDISILNEDNRAFKCPATCSGFQKGHPAEHATDGDSDTGWTAPSDTPGAWLQVDLGKPAPVKTFEIEWEQSSKYYEYTLDGSLDGTTWTKLADNTTAVPTSPDSPSLLSRIQLPAPAEARYIRVTVTGGLTRNRWPSINELRVLK